MRGEIETEGENENGEREGEGECGDVRGGDGGSVTVRMGASEWNEDKLLELGEAGGKFGNANGGRRKGGVGEGSECVRACGAEVVATDKYLRFKGFVVVDAVDADVEEVEEVEEEVELGE
jgi:hypothetical protein